MGKVSLIFLLLGVISILFIGIRMVYKKLKDEKEKNAENTEIISRIQKTNSDKHKSEQEIHITVTQSNSEFKDAHEEYLVGQKEIEARKLRFLEKTN